MLLVTVVFSTFKEMRLQPRISEKELYKEYMPESFRPSMMVIWRSFEYGLAGH